MVFICIRFDLYVNLFFHDMISFSLGLVLADYVKFFQAFCHIYTLYKKQQLHIQTRIEIS